MVSVTMVNWQMKGVGLEKTLSTKCDPSPQLFLEGDKGLHGCVPNAEPAPM